MKQNSYQIIPVKEENYVGPLSSSVGSFTETKWTYLFYEAKNIYLDEDSIRENARDEVEFRKQEKFKTFFQSLVFSALIAMAAAFFILNYQLNSASDDLDYKFSKKYERMEFSDKISFLKKNHIESYSTFYNTTIYSSITLGILSLFIITIYYYTPNYSKHRDLQLKTEIVSAFDFLESPEQIEKYKNESYKKRFKGYPGEIYKVKRKFGLSDLNEPLQLFHVVPAEKVNDLKSLFN